MVRQKARSPGRKELIEQKRRLESEINALTAELRRRHGRGAPAADIEARLLRARNEHYATRLAIDRAGRCS